MQVAVVLIPSDLSKPLKTHHISWDETKNLKIDHGILSLLHQDDDDIEINNFDAMDDRIEVPLLRPGNSADSPGLYAYYRSYGRLKSQPTSNVRATRLAMAFGLMSLRFHGDVVIARSHPSARPRWSDVTVEDLRGACISPDLRSKIQNELVCGIGDDDDAREDMEVTPLWIKNAAQKNYHDAVAIARLRKVMKNEKKHEQNVGDENENDSDNNDDDDNCDENDSDSNDDNCDDNCDGNDDDDEVITEKTTTKTNKVEASALKTTNNMLTNSSSMEEKFSLAAKSPLCLHCRRPTQNLCKSCFGAYFCSPQRGCRTVGWSHDCQCRTWESYVSRREELSTFEYFDPEWQAKLISREFQLSENPYKKFLASQMNIKYDEDCEVNDSLSLSSWWRTETDGWAGGDSSSARQVDITTRKSYLQGFAPIPSDYLPPTQRVCDRDYERAGLLMKKNAVGLRRLLSWEDYYRLRDIPPQSPVALLCTFPLTIYHAIVEYGEVPVTVARMLRRPLRIHVVGTEKELNFLDLFKEVGFLLPEDLKVELIFVAREDMLPTKCRMSTSTSNDDDNDDRFLLKVEMTINLTVGVVGGTYAGEGIDENILDPNFDCGSGPPDMIIAMNAGLYAYESWRSVIDYLYHNKGVVGVFSDYNEYSGYNCASLGGAASRESLVINPFRQPLSLPVYSMNLPQFSNGFIYVFNEQELD